MPAPPTKMATLSLKSTQCKLNGIPISGYADEDDALVIEQNEDTTTITVGADGVAVASLTNDDHMTVTIRLIQTSRAYYWLDLQRAKWLRLANLGTAPIIPFTFFNPVTGERISSAQIAFINNPARTQGKTAKTREFIVFLNSPQVTAPAANAI